MRKFQMHVLKTRISAWSALPLGGRRLEIRKDDRGYAVDDLLELREWDHEAEQFTGRVCVARVTHILRSDDLACGSGLLAGYVALSVVPVGPPSPDYPCPKCGHIEPAAERDYA